MGSKTKRIRRTPLDGIYTAARTALGYHGHQTTMQHLLLHAASLALESEMEERKFMAEALNAYALRKRERANHEEEQSDD